MTTGEKIKEKRKELGITVEKLCSEVGINRSTLYRYENDKTENIPTAVALKLANVLKISVSELLSPDKDLYAELWGSQNLIYTLNNASFKSKYMNDNNSNLKNTDINSIIKLLSLSLKLSQKQLAAIIATMEAMIDGDK